MPNFDGRDPRGAGPMTGRGREFCMVPFSGQNKWSGYNRKSRGFNARGSLLGRFVLPWFIRQYQARRRWQFVDSLRKNFYDKIKKLQFKKSRLQISLTALCL